MDVQIKNKGQVIYFCTVPRLLWQEPSYSSLQLLELQWELVPASIHATSKNDIKSHWMAGVAGLEIFPSFENLKIYFLKIINKKYTLSSL